MPPADLTLLLGLAGFFLALLTVLPGLALKLVAVGKRVRGRPVGSPAVLGPLFWDELVRVTRRGAQFRLRTAYSLFLLASLLVAYLSAFSDINPITLLLGGHEVPRERMAAFAEEFFHVFLFCQLAALTAVTPVFAGGSVTEEKDRGTLIFLQTTLLTNREIVLGKLAARVAFVLGLALTGLPVLALTLLFGGVDPHILATSFVAAVMSTVSLAAFSFWQATRKDTLKEVLTSAYVRVGVWTAFSFCLAAWVGPLLSCLSPFVFTTFSVGGAGRVRFDLYETAVAFTAFHGCVAAFYALLGMGNIRTPLIDQRPFRPMPGAAAPVPVEAPAQTAGPWNRERPPTRYKHVPYLDEGDPLLWKETYFGSRLPTFETDVMKGCLTGLLVATLLPVAFGIFIALLTSDRPQEVLNGLFRVVSIGYGAFLIPLAGVRAVGCVSRERQRQTLESLFMLPFDRADFLRAKWRAAYLWLFPWLVGIGAFAAGMVFTLSVHWLGLALSAALLAAAVVFFLTLAVWLSVRCRTVVRATTWYLGFVFASFLLPPMAAVLVRGAVDLFLGGAGPSLLASSTSALSLPFALDDLAFPWSFNDTGRRSRRYFEGVEALAPTLLLFLALLGASALLWRDAVRRFENEAR